MRQRYYSSEMKRFLNQDVVRGSLISNVFSFAQNAVAGRENYLKMYEKYIVEGKSFDSGTPWEIASLGLSIAGMGILARKWQEMPRH